MGADSFFYVPEMVREITPFSDAKALWRLYRIFRDQKPDVIHAHSSKAGFLSRVAAWAAGVKRVYYSPRGYSFLQSDRSDFSRGLYSFLERSASKIGEVVAVSESEASLARGLGAPKVRVVRDAYLGDIPDISDRAQKPDVKEILVCACGRLSFARNPEAFLRLAKLLTDARASLRCLWIGGGELQPSVEKLLKELDMAGKLELSGWVPHDKALRAMARADIFVHYSRWEGLPNTVLEAMACGLPVVASDVVGNRDLIRPGENGYLVSTEAELLERTLELADQPELRARLGASGRAMVQAEFSRERMLGEIAGLYASGERIGVSGVM